MLSAPLVKAPITPCTSKIKVTNTVTGAAVRVFEDGRVIGRGNADGPVTFIKLDPGVTLTPGGLITARQDWNGDFSFVTPDSAAVKVLATPTAAMLGEIISRASPLECGICLWLEGIVPGATVTVTIPGSPAMTMVADWTAVHVNMPPLANGVLIQVQQAACGIVGPAVTLPAPLRHVTGQVGHLDPPGIDTPLYLCQRALTVHPLPGAEVVLEHDGQSNHFCFGATTGTFWLGRPLNFQDKIRVLQEFHSCEIRSAEAEYIPTESIPPAPGFPNPVCNGDVQVEVTGLFSGAHIQFLTNSEPEQIFFADASEAPYQFNLPPLGNATRLGVRQILCDSGSWSDTSFIDLLQAGPQDRPWIEPPVFGCGAAVAVRGLKAGTRVRVISDFWRGPIGETTGDGDEFVDVPLYFPLISGDQLHIETIECGLFRALPDMTPVQLPPEGLATPELDDPLDDCGGRITVRQLVPGAILDVELVNDPKAPDDVATLLASVPVTRTVSNVAVPPLKPDWLIRVRQRLCGQTSRPSPVAKTGDRILRYDLDDRTHRLCQLSGSLPFAPPRTFDTTSVDVLGTDLGISVEHGGRLYFFFGDCKEGEDSDPDGDPIGWTTAASPEPNGVKLNYLLNKDGVFRRLVVEGLPTLGNFDVPTGGFAYDGRLYLFVSQERMQSSYLAVTKQPSNDPNQNLQKLYKVASTLNGGAGTPMGQWLIHVSPTVVKNADWSDLPAVSGEGLLMFGTSHYQASNVYLAWAPLTQGQNPPPPSQWRYFKEDDPVRWVATIPVGQEPTKLLKVPDPGPVAELSVRWEPRMQRWIMTHVQPGQVVLRTSRLPSGPWSDPVVIFDPNDPSRDADNHLAGEQFVLFQHADANQNRLTVAYAPYIISRWTRFDRSTRTLILYYTMSVEDPPYNPQLMRSRLLCG